MPLTADAAPRPTFLPRPSLWTEEELAPIPATAASSGADLTHAGRSYEHGREWRAHEGWTCPTVLHRWVTPEIEPAVAAIRAAYAALDYVELEAVAPVVYIARSPTGDHSVRVRATLDSDGSPLVVVDVAQTGCVW